ncbi:probable protein phosphatase 2C 55 [Salvia miltiorrhiza]|uniref:probable protein phosphatase 2C 55 n=1 Tax=Salvia miltiorrhiza TaxID=226208 RepID=UPI0025AC9943|nr:probable protein phosphatase 2C 55 [Salvia miltiorrhiza]
MSIIKNELTMIADSFYIPKENPAKPDGEDAHFFCRKAQVIGVADGVGGWAKKGIDAGEYARELMRNAADVVKDSRPADVDPKSVLVDAFAKTEAPGSSTACIISLAGNRLRAANVGDSGFAVIRGGRTVYRSPVQHYKFNAPYQLGPTSGSPKKAEEIAVEMESGDIVVAATDGLFDNVFPKEVEAVVGRFPDAMMPPGRVARDLAEAARVKSLHIYDATPFELASYQAGFVRLGGKKDDITVVVAYVYTL